MLTLLLFAALVVPAAEEAPRPSFHACIDASEGVTAAMLDCIGAEYDYQDVRLNAAYKRAMARLAPAQRVVLRNSERRWLREREPKCMEEAAEESGGTLGTILRNNCMLFALIERTEWLDAYRPAG